jgi:hypothetical protein
MDFPTRSASFLVWHGERRIEILSRGIEHCI